MNSIIENGVMRKDATPKTCYEPSECASSFVFGMENKQRTRFKKMLEQGVECGRGIAASYGVPYEEFIEAVREIL